MSFIRYLAYGSNLLPRRLEARLGAVRAAGTVALPGWDLRFHKRGADGTGKCNLVRAAGATAHGALYDIATDARSRLDEIEGAGRGYAGTHIACAGHGVCYVYLALEHAIDESLVPFDWYHALVLAGARHHAFPATYVAAIAARATQIDADEVRRAQHLALAYIEPRA